MTYWPRLRFSVKLAMSRPRLSLITPLRSKYLPSTRFRWGYPGNKKAPSFEGTFIFGAGQKRAPSGVSENALLFEHVLSRFVRVWCLNSVISARCSPRELPHLLKKLSGYQQCLLFNEQNLGKPSSAFWCWPSSE